MHDIIGDIQKTAGRQYPQRFLDEDGNERHHIRARRWGQGDSTSRSVAMTNDKTRHTPSDQPEPMRDRVACVNYTVTELAPAGKLTAYRWAGQASIKLDGFYGCARPFEAIFQR